MSQPPRRPDSRAYALVRILIVGIVIMGIAWMLGVWSDNVRDTESNGSPAVVTTR